MKPARSSRFVWLFGVALLVVSIAGAGWVLNGSMANSSSSPPIASDHAVPFVVCFGHVDLENGVTPLYPTVAGRVTSIEAHENDVVKAGAVLIRLDDFIAHLRVKEAKADLQAAEEQLAQAQKLPEQYALKKTQQKSAIAGVGHKLTAARAVVARKRELEKKEQLSPKEVEAAEAMVQELEALETVEKSKLRELDLVDPTSDAKRAKADVEAKQARLDQALRGEQECVVKAPVDGMVLRVHVSPGEVLGAQPRQPAIDFCPAGERIIRAEIEQEFAGRVAVGQAATIQDDITSSAPWKGKVVRISDWYTHRRSILQEPFQFNDVRTLECIIAFDPGQPQMRIGQRVRVTIEQPRETSATPQSMEITKSR